MLTNEILGMGVQAVFDQREDLLSHKEAMDWMMADRQMKNVKLGTFAKEIATQLEVWRKLGVGKSMCG